MPLFKVTVTVETTLEADNKEHARAIFFERQKTKGSVVGKRSLRIEECSAQARLGDAVLDQAVEKALQTGEEVRVVYDRAQESQAFIDAQKTLWAHLEQLGVLDVDRSHPEQGLYQLNNGGSILLGLG